MPAVRHGKKKRVPLDVEPDLMADIEDTSRIRKINRTTLLRILVKYGLNNLEQALKQGDVIWTYTSDSEK